MTEYDATEVARLALFGIGFFSINGAGMWACLKIDDKKRERRFYLVTLLFFALIFVSVLWS